MERIKTIATTAILLMASVVCVAQEFPSQTLSLLARWDDTTITPNSYWVHSRYSGCTGWFNPISGHEYAIIGSQMGTHFIDLADPQHPREADYVPGRRSGCLWREYRTYSHYAYMISYDDAPNSFQVADLSYLPDSVHVVYDSDTLFQKAHTLYIDGDKLYAGLVSTLTDAYPMAVYSLADPERPQFLRSLRDDYSHIPIVHDMFVRHDTVYASCGLQGLHIFTYMNGVFQALDSFSTGNTNYNHSSTVSPGGMLYFCEEVPTGRPVVALDVTDAENITMVSSFYAHQDGTPHNPYLLGSYLFVAHYQDGLQVFDVSDPEDVKVAGYVDTYPDNIGGYNDPAYQGAWGAWPYLPSGRILVSDMNRGLFIVDADALLRKSPSSNAGLSLYPNPASGYVKLEFGNRAGQETIEVKFSDVAGRTVIAQEVEGTGMNRKQTVDISRLAKGMYLVHAMTSDGTDLGTVKFIRQ